MLGDLGFLLAVTGREQRLDLGSIWTKATPRDGNLCGQFAFKMKYLLPKEVCNWQKPAFPLQYLNARRAELGTLQARKRAVAVFTQAVEFDNREEVSIGLVGRFS